MRYQIEFCPNPEYVNIGVDKRLVDCFVRGSKPPVDNLEKQNACKGLANLLEVIDGIPGVTKVSAQRYELTIRKSPMFEWDQIIPLALEAMKTFLADGDLQEKAPPIYPERDPDGDDEELDFGLDEFEDYDDEFEDYFEDYNDFDDYDEAEGYYEEFDDYD